MAQELKKILYAEDDNDIRTLVEAILSRKTNFEIMSCETGLKALHLAQKITPDLIILDVNMPEMDGPTTFQALKNSELLKNIPIIFMTAKVQNHEIAAYYELGVNGVIIKPFNPTELLPAIEKTWSDFQTAKMQSA